MARRAQSLPQDRVPGMSMSIKTAISRQWQRLRPGVPLNLESPRLYSERIQWLKLYDERRNQAQWCDKVKARDKVAAMGLADLVVPLADGYPRVCKNNHDSGYPLLCNDERECRRAVAELKRKPSDYGANKGEWGYAGIARKVYCEQALPNPLDCKFHMVCGEVRMIQMATGGTGKVRYCLLYLPDGTPIPHRLSMREQWVPAPPPMPDWVSSLLPIAERMSSGYRYVRVDLLHAAGKPWFGEMTFWPMSGFCDPANDAYFGDLIVWETQT
jgi:hypothetical protein